MADEMPLHGEGEALPEAVDPAEVAALERAAQRGSPIGEIGLAAVQADRDEGARRMATMRAAGLLHEPPPETPDPVTERLTTPEKPAGLTITVPMPIEIQQQLDELAVDHMALKRWVRHTMHLTMALAHRLAISPDEIEVAKTMVDKADAQLTKGTP